MGCRRGRFSVCLVCRGYGSSVGEACGVLRILGSWRNLGGSLDSVGAGCSQRKLGVARLRNFRVHVVRFLGVSWVFLDSIG